MFGTTYNINDTWLYSSDIPILGVHSYTMSIIENVDTTKHMMDDVCDQAYMIALFGIQMAYDLKTVFQATYYETCETCCITMHVG